MPFVIVYAADWDVTSGTKHEFESVYSEGHSVIQVDSTHYLNVFVDNDDDANAVILTVDTNDWTITSGTSHEFSTSADIYYDLVQIDSTHFIVAYVDYYSYDGYVEVLTVDTDTWTVTSSASYEYGTDESYHQSITQIDATHYLIAWADSAHDGRTRVLTVNTDTWAISGATVTEFDTSQGMFNSLVKIDSTHYLNAYQGSVNDGFAIVLTVNPATWAVSGGTKLEFDTTDVEYNDVIQVDSTHYLNVFADSSDDGRAVILTVDTDAWTITAGTELEFDTINGQYNSIEQIDSTHYLVTYRGNGLDGYAIVLTVDTSAWTITAGTKHEFDTADVTYNSLVQIDSSHYLNVYTDSADDGNAVVISVEVPASGSCTPPASGDWEINSADNCVISDDTINIDDITFINDGTITFDNCIINVKSFERKSSDAGTDTVITITNNCNVTIKN